MKQNCQICGTKLIFDPPNFICPKCNKLCLLSQIDAVQIWSKQNTWFSEKFNKIISTSNKRELLLWILDEREMLAAEFFKDIPSLDLNKFLAINILIKEVFEKYETIGIVPPNQDSVEKLINYFCFFVGLQEKGDLLKDEFAYYIAKEPFDLETIDESKLMSNFKFVYAQQWSGIVRTFEDNLILTADSTNLYIEKHRKEYAEIRASLPPKRDLSMEDTIKNNYPMFKSFKTSLTKNTIFAHFFDLTYLQKKQISPGIFQKFIREFRQKNTNSIFSECVPRKEFFRFIRRKLKEFNKYEIYDTLVFGKENKDIFPFFVELDGFVYISPHFLFLMNTFYIPFYHKDLYDNETTRLSYIFEENEVPDKLRMNGFKVRPNVKDRKKNPTLQIDSIAWKNKVLYVIEVKIWDISCAFENKQTHLIRERDLRGIVDGFKYTNGEPSPIPSLSKKIDFVKSNIERLCPDYKEIKDIKGLIITKSYPPIDSYKGVTMIGFNEIKDLDSKYNDYQ